MGAPSAWWPLVLLAHPTAAALVGNGGGRRASSRRLVPRATPPSRVVPVPHACYASPTYWEDLYANLPDEDLRDWLVPYDSALQKLIAASPLSAVRDEPVIELGCGNSPLAERLYLDGWLNIIACDISAAAVQAAKVRQEATSARVGGHGPQYFVADVKKLSQTFETHVFGGALDKGTLDALCCSEGWDYEAGQYFDSVASVLRPGGVWLCISLTPPSAILPILERRLEEWEAAKAKPWGKGLYVYQARRKASAM